MKYEPQLRERFLRAAFRVKNEGGGGEQIFRAARASGYRGSKAGIDQMMRSTKEFKEAAEEPENPLQQEERKNSPKTNGNGHKEGKPRDVAHLPAELSETLTTTLREGLKGTVDEAVRKMTNEAIDEVIARLQKAKL